MQLIVRDVCCPLDPSLLVGGLLDVPELARGGREGHDLELGAVVGAVVIELEAVVWLSALFHGTLIMAWRCVLTGAEKTDAAVRSAPGGVVVAGGAVHKDDGGAVSEGRLLDTHAQVGVAELESSRVLARVRDLERQ